MEEVAAGLECGLGVDDYTSWQENDTLDCYQVRARGGWGLAALFAPALHGGLHALLPPHACMHACMCACMLTSSGTRNSRMPPCCTPPPQVVTKSQRLEEAKAATYDASASVVDDDE